LPAVKARFENSNLTPKVAIYYAFLVLGWFNLSKNERSFFYNGGMSEIKI